MIKKTKKGYRVVSHTTGRNLGTYKSKSAAKKRLKQIQFFKNLEKSSGGPGSLKSKVKNKSLLKKVRKRK